MAPAAQALARYRLPENEASRLADRRPPAWVFLTGLNSICRRPACGTRMEAGRPRGEKNPDMKVAIRLRYWILKPLTPHA